MDRELAKKFKLNGPEGMTEGLGREEFDAFSRAYDELDYFITMKFKADGDLLKKWHDARHVLFIIDCEIRHEFEGQRKDRGIRA